MARPFTCANCGITTTKRAHFLWLLAVVGFFNGHIWVSDDGPLCIKCAPSWATALGRVLYVLLAICILLLVWQVFLPTSSEDVTPNSPLLGDVRREGDIMTVKRMDNVGIVVEDIDAAIEFFTELGLELEGRAPIEGDWADGVTGLRDMRVEIAMMRTPDGHSRLEMSRFLAPPVIADHRRAPVNALGYLRVMFTVEDIDDTLARLVKRGAELVGEVVQYEDTYRLCYIRGPEGILIGLAQELGQQTSR
jgi:catechol 2,3-dioxygenase-like lactoylglutathione lyase family enzyme